jgi:hypothetical protein
MVSGHFGRSKKKALQLEFHQLLAQNTKHNPNKSHINKIRVGFCLDCVWCFGPTADETQAAKPFFSIAQNDLKPCSGERVRTMLPIALISMEKGELWRFYCSIRILVPMLYNTFSYRSRPSVVVVRRRPSVV